nr:zonadhesin [Anolis sagrei ordinatus]
MSQGKGKRTNFRCPLPRELGKYICQAPRCLQPICPGISPDRQRDGTPLGLAPGHPERSCDLVFIALLLLYGYPFLPPPTPAIFSRAKQTHGAELLQKPFATKSALPSCDFDNAERPFCGWTQSEDDGGQWLRGDGPRPGQSPGPPGGKPERRGYYIYPEAGKTVQLQSPALDPDAAEICVEFLYYLYSLSTSAQLAVKVQDASGNASTLWTKGGMQSSSWLLGTVTVQNPVRRPFQVVFAATRAETTEIDMGLDSISIRVGPCSPCVTGCDFDSIGDLCGWENPAEGDIQWEQWTGAGDNPDVGPADDFSKPGFGSYMLLDSFDSKNSGTALLKSPLYESQGGCLSLDFYYTLHGVSSDTTLKVYAAAVAGGELGAPLLTLSGEHGPNWNPGVVNYTGTAEVQFVFEGTYRGKPGLAVDSIHVSPCEEVFTQCNFNDNANPFCGWVGSGDNDDVSWTRTNHSTPTEETGPPGDYPDGKGYYIYAEGGSLKPGQSLRLTSRAFCTDTEACVEFYYYMYGIVEVQTQLRVLLEGPSGAEVTLWTRSGIQSPAWLFGSVTVPYGGPQPSRVLFEVVRGNHPYLDVSLDNISVRRGPCSGSGTPLPPTTSSIATSTHAGPVVTLPPGSPVTSRSTTASPVPTSHVVPTTHSNTTPEKPTLTSPTTTTTASDSTATTRDSHVSSTAPATSGQGSQTTPGVPKPTSHPTSDAPSTSKASTTTTTVSQGDTTTTPTTSVSKTSTTSTTTSQGNTATTLTPTTSVSKTSTTSITTSHGSTATTATITTSDSKTTTTSTTASHSNTTTTPAPTTSISKTSTTSTTASHSNTTTTSSTHHTQLPITSQTSTTHGSTTSTTPASTSQGNLTTRTTSPATISTTSDSKTSTTSTTAAQGSTTVATSPSTTRGSTQLPITRPTSGSQLSTTTGHTSHVSTAGSSSTSHPSVTTARPTPPKSSTTAITHISPSTFPSHNQTSTTQGSQSPGHTTAAPSTTRQTTPITTSSATTKITTISTTTVSSSPTTHTAGQPTTTSGTTLQANTTITQSATTLTTLPHTSPTTLSPDSLTSRPPSPTVSKTTTLGKTTTTASLLTSSVSPSTLHTTTVGHVTTISTTASTKSTPTTPGSSHTSPTTVGHTSPSSTHTSATSIAITTTTGSGTPSLTTTTRPPIRTTTTQHTTSLATIESSRTTVTTTERSSTKMPVSPEATTTTTLPTTTAKPTPTQGVSIGTTITSTAPVTPPGQGICTISGDPHYTTYDGRLFHFMGTCTYLLSTVCNATAGLPTFRVQATNEHRGANKQVSYVKSVSVEVYGTEIVLLKARRVTVNGQRVTLPVSLAEDRVWVRLSGTFVLVQTDFGLSVRFDGNHHAEVSVPPSYYGYLCGLCGNYNGEVSDDNLMPDGTSAGTDADKLGESWQVPDAGDEGCSNTGDPGECDKDLAAEAEKPSSCGILTDPQGPFSPCHSKIPPEGFFESCVYDFCGTGGDEGTLCFALQSYADRCAQAGVNIAWRNSSFCPLNCPPGSSYSPCVPPCPATCLDGPSAPSCSGLPCLEGCICDEGRVLSGETCVPIDQCGCTDTSGQYHPVGESWMADSNCTERCTCGAQNNVTCQEWSCSPIQECRPQEGVLGCQDTGVAACHVAGDPHYYTFDGTMVSFMGTCTYTLVALCQSDPRLPSFTITAKNEERGQPEASYLRQVTLQLHGYTVTLQKSRRVLIDGQRVRTPVEGRIPGVSITSSGIYVILETDFGLVMKFDGNHHLEIQLPGTYFDKVCGMCGNFNNQSQDDLLMPNGHLAANDSQFGNSWKAPGDADPGCQPDDREDLEPHCSPAEMERLSALCGEILGPKYQPCHGVINPQLFVQNCLFDLCEYDGMASVLCDNVQSYVEACKSQGVTGLSWRNSTFCPLPCPPHSHYTECASPCPATCCNLYAPAACQSRTTCVEGCTCNRGYVLSDDTCVSARDCGCLDSQHEYHSPGDTWVTLNCREHCTCLGSGEISCRAFECLPGSTCALSSSGQRFCKPGDFHQCVISGDPHYRTFDRFVHHFQGLSTYTLSRTLPGLPSVLVPFSVAGRNRRRFPFHRFSFLREVYVSVYNYSITFMQRRKLVVSDTPRTPPEDKTQPCLFL